MATEGNYGANIAKAREKLVGLESTNNNMIIQVYDLEGYVRELNNAWVNETEDIESKKVIMKNLETTLHEVEVVARGITEVSKTCNGYLDEIIYANRLGND